nr:hypothetical protein LTR18_007116 [Exophiala xenobiotica]
MTRILGKGDGSVPILYEASIRVPYTASRQVFMGAPDYAEAWPNALKTDRLLAVTEGNANTIEQVKYTGTILSINKFRDPLKKWQRDGPKRMVFTKKFLKWFFLSFPNSPYTVKKFKSGFKFARHTFERSALLTTMAAIHDMEWQSNGMRAFEKESLDMKIMPIAGAKGGKLYGFALRHEDDDYSLSDGMHFKIFFKRDKATEERADKKAEWYFRGWHGRDCHLNSPQCRFFVADNTILGHHADHDGIKPSVAMNLEPPARQASMTTVGPARTVQDDMAEEDRIRRLREVMETPALVENDIPELDLVEGDIPEPNEDEPSLLRFLYQLPYMMQFIPGRADIEAKLRTAIKTEQLEFKANGKTRKARGTVGFEWTRAHEKSWVASAISAAFVVLSRLIVFLSCGCELIDAEFEEAVFAYSKKGETTRWTKCCAAYERYSRNQARMLSLAKGTGLATLGRQYLTEEIELEGKSTIKNLCAQSTALFDLVDTFGIGIISLLPPKPVFSLTGHALGT